MTYEEWKVANWDKAHQELDVSALTGSSLEGHMAALGAGEFFVPDTTLLCIGVGTCSWVHEAVVACKRVEALDISAECKGRLPEGVVLHTDPKTLPDDTFTLALSLWVAPHMTNHDLEVQIREVVRSLAPNGLLCVHYKEPMDDSAVVDNREGAEDEWKRAGAALMMRRRAYFDSLVEWAGGKVIARHVERPSQFHQIIEVAAHIMKASP